MTRGRLFTLLFTLLLSALLLIFAPTLAGQFGVAIPAWWPGPRQISLPAWFRLPSPQPAAFSPSAPGTNETQDFTPTLTPSLTPSGTWTPTSSPSATIPAPDFSELARTIGSSGTAILALSEDARSHLFAFTPTALSPLTRLTSGPWEDITPAASPDGQLIAFSSNRNGHWDLYLLELRSGVVAQLTNSADYKANPSWSPDGLFLAYEQYSEQGGLDIYILPLDTPEATIQLTNTPAAEWGPAWSPQGRHIAFVSTQSGDAEIWMADLDNVDQRFRNVSVSSNTEEGWPAWSPDGSYLAWSSRTREGIQSVMLLSDPLKSQDSGARARNLGNGFWPGWSADGSLLLAGLETPNQTYLTAYKIPSGQLALPALLMPGTIEGIGWSKESLPEALPESYAVASQITPPPAFLPVITPPQDLPGGRMFLAELADLSAPYPLLQDWVDESFQALRQRVAADVGWDFLANLENAYVPLTSPLEPGMYNDWLYTGRAFAFNPLPINAGWLVVMREDFGSQTYWRIYIRARFQDGSQGRPLHNLPWDLYTRYAGDPRSYENGGSWAASIPQGYWVDFTRAAQAYGWERLPALITWRSAFSSVRFNTFTNSGGLDWLTAMREIYPREALDTPTPIPTATNTPTATLRPTRTPYMSPTPRPTRTPTPTRTTTVQATPTPQIGDD